MLGNSTYLFNIYSQWPVAQLLSKYHTSTQNKENKQKYFYFFKKNALKVKINTPNKQTKQRELKTMYIPPHLSYTLPQFVPTKDKD